MANHLQITYYALLAVIIFGLTEMIFAFRRRQLATLFQDYCYSDSAPILAVSVNFASMLTTYEYGKVLNQGKIGTDSTPR